MHYAFKLTFTELTMSITSNFHGGKCLKFIDFLKKQDTHIAKHKKFQPDNGAEKQLIWQGSYATKQY